MKLSSIENRAPTRPDPTPNGKECVVLPRGSVRPDAVPNGSRQSGPHRVWCEIGAGASCQVALRVGRDARHTSPPAPSLSPAWLAAVLRLVGRTVPGCDLQFASFGCFGHFVVASGDPKHPGARLGTAEHLGKRPAFLCPRSPGSTIVLIAHRQRSRSRHCPEKQTRNGPKGSVPGRPAAVANPEISCHFNLEG